MVDFVIRVTGASDVMEAFLQNRVERLFSMSPNHGVKSRFAFRWRDVKGLNGEGRIGRLFHRDLGRLSQR